MLTIEQIAAVQKGQLESLFEMTGKAFAGVERLVELNLQVARTSLLEAQDAAKAGAGAKSAQEMFAFQSALLQPAVDKAAAYGKHLQDILVDTRAEMGKVGEGQLQAARARFASAFDGAVKGAPAGSEAVTALVKSAIDAAGNTMDTLNKATKQAVDVATTNLHTMSLSTIKATAGVAKATRQAA
jgi:phasin family protein